MSGFGSDLHRFGLDPEGEPNKEQWANLCRLIRALVNNPSLNIGTENSEIVMPQYAGGSAATKGKSEYPFLVTLHTVTGPPNTYKVTVGWGYVIERKPGTGDAIDEHEPSNMWDTVDPTKLRRHDITVAQAVYIRCEVDADGRINEPGPGSPKVRIVVGPDNEESVHYIPKVDDGTSGGAAGYYMYKLAVLEAPATPGNTPVFKKWLTGSHIDHVPEIPSMLSALAAGTNIGVIPKEWDNTARAYKLRAIKGLCGITVTQESDHIAVKPSGDTFRVRIWATTITVDFFTYEVIVAQSASPTQEFWVLNGVWHLTEPANWSECGGSEYPIHDVSYMAPSAGGS